MKQLSKRFLYLRMNYKDEEKLFIILNSNLQHFLSMNDLHSQRLEEIQLRFPFEMENSVKTVHYLHFCGKM